MKENDERRCHRKVCAEFAQVFNLAGALLAHYSLFRAVHCAQPGQLDQQRRFARVQMRHPPARMHRDLLQ